MGSLIIILLFILAAAVLMAILHIYNLSDGYTGATIILSFIMGECFIASIVVLYSDISSPKPLDVYQGKTVMVIEKKTKDDGTISCDTSIVFKDDKDLAGKKLNHIKIESNMHIINK